MSSQSLQSELATIRVVVVGAGGHGQVVADMLLRSAEQGDGLVAVGYVDDDRQLIGQRHLGLPVLGTISELSRIEHDAVIVAIGDNERRRLIYRRLQISGERFVIARHPSAVIAPTAIIGVGTMICAGAIVNPLSRIGENVILNTACSIDHHNSIGDHVHIGPGVRTGGEVAVGAGSLVGIGATIMPGRSIGADCVVGAASLVHGNVAAATVVIGVPARAIGMNHVLNGQKQ